MRSFMRRTLFGSVIAAALPISGADAATPPDAFMAGLAGPGGKSTASGEPLKEAEVDKSGKITGMRASCPQGGLATPKEMVGNEVWYELKPDGRFGSYTSKAPTRLSELTFIRLEGADVAVFYFSTPPKGATATMAITRLTPDRIRVSVTSDGTTTETHYIRCKRNV
jgi:hypothetical protein